MLKPNSLVALIAGSTLTLGIAAAIAAECPPDQQGVTIAGTLNVREGQWCYLTDVTVQKDVIVKKNAVLVALRSTTGGNLKVDAGGRLELIDSTVANDVQTTDAAFVDISGSTIGHNLKMVKSKSTETMSIIGNSITNDAQINENVTAGLTISDNTVGNNLACGKNNQAPAGVNNQAKTLKEQCALLNQ